MKAPRQRFARATKLPASAFGGPQRPVFSFSETIGDCGTPPPTPDIMPCDRTGRALARPVDLIPSQIAGVAIGISAGGKALPLLTTRGTRQQRDDRRAFRA